MFVAHDVRFMVVGAYALAVLGRPRATGDLDVWVDATADNAPRVLAAFGEFGAPLRDLTLADLSRPGVVFQIGLPPLRIDVLTAIDGVDFATAWRRHLVADFDGVTVPVIGRKDYLANKRATGRLQDRADAERLDPRQTAPSRRSKTGPRQPRR